MAPFFQRIFVLLISLPIFLFPLQAQQTDSLFVVQRLLKNKKYIEAEKLSRRILQQDSTAHLPSGESVWTMLGLALDGQEKHKEAIQTLLYGYRYQTRHHLADLYLNYHLIRLICKWDVRQNAVHITDLFEELIRRISPDVQKDLWALLYQRCQILLFDDEKSLLEEPANQKQPVIGRLLHKAFQRQDPTPATRENEFIYLFFKRASVAEEKFRETTIAKGYDDRGDIFILLGPTSRMYINHSGTRGTGGYALYPFEMWFYKHIHPNLFLTFVGRGGKNFFRIVTGPEEIIGTFYRGHSAFYSGVRTIWIPLNIRFDLYTSLAPLHPTFMERIKRMQEQIDPVEALEYARTHFPDEDRAHFQWTQKLIHMLVLGTDFSQDTLTVFYNWHAFRGEHGKTSWQLNYFIPNNELEYIFTPEYHTSIRSQIGIFDQDFNRVAADSAMVFVSNRNVNDTFISGFTFNLKPGKYYVILRVENPESKKLKLVRFPVQVAPFPENELAMSQLYLLSEIRKSDKKNIFLRKGLLLIPRPFSLQEKQSPIHVYFEVYNLQASKSGKRTFTVSYQLFPQKPRHKGLGKIFHFFHKSSAPKPVFTEVQHYQANSATATVTWQKRLENLIPDRYRLHVQVTDDVSGQTVENDLLFTLLE